MSEFWLGFFVCIGLWLTFRIIMALIKWRTHMERLLGSDWNFVYIDNGEKVWKRKWREGTLFK
jgi:hypothetical protein